MMITFRQRKLHQVHISQYLPMHIVDNSLAWWMAVYRKEYDDGDDDDDDDDDDADDDDYDDDDGSILLISRQRELYQVSQSLLANVVDHKLIGLIDGKVYRHKSHNEQRWLLLWWWW